MVGWWGVHWGRRVEPDLRRQHCRVQHDWGNARPDGFVTGACLCICLDILRAKASSGTGGYLAKDVVGLWDDKLVEL